MSADARKATELIRMVTVLMLTSALLLNSMSVMLTLIVRITREVMIATVETDTEETASAVSVSFWYIQSYFS